MLRIVLAVTIIGMFACASSTRTSPQIQSQTPSGIEPTSAMAMTAQDPSAKIGQPDLSEATLAKAKVFRQALPRMPQAVTSFGAAAVGSTMYVLGGYFGEPHDYSREGQSGRFDAYDSTTKTWKKMPGIPALQSVTLTAIGESLVRVGGMRAENAATEKTNLHSVSEVAVFSPRSGQWRDLRALPSPRSSHDTGGSDRRVYVVGGWNLPGKGQAKIWHDTSLVLDLSESTPVWREIAQPFQRRALAVAVGAHQLFAIGGIDKDGPSSRVDVLDLRREQWTRGPDLPSDGFGAAAIMSPDSSVLVSTRNGQIYRLAPGSLTWEEHDHLLFPRFFHRLVAVGTQIWALGGINGMTSDDRVVHVESVNGLDRQAQAFHWSIAWPGTAKNRQAVVLKRDSLHLYGGNNSLEQHDFAERNFVDEGWILHLTSLRTEAAESLPVARQSMVVASSGANDQFQLLGGFGWDGKVARTHDEAFHYDREAKAWLRKPAVLPIPLSQFHMMHDRERRLVVGGLDYHPERPPKDRFRHNTAIFASDDDNTPFVDSRMTMPPRRAFASAQIGRDFYIVGGMKDGFESVENCGRLSVSDPQSWQAIACPKQSGLGARLINVDDQLVLVRGRIAVRDKEPLAAAVAIYDAATDQWRDALATLPIPNTHLHALAHGKDLLLFSTHVAEAKAELVLLKLPHVVH